MYKSKTLAIQPDDRVLLVQLRAMGDTLLLTPLIRAFKEAYPEVELDILVQPLPAQILQNSPHITNIYIDEGLEAGIDRYAQLISTLRQEQYDLVIDFISTPGSALLTYLTGGKQRIGYRLKYRIWAYTHPVERRTEPVYNPLTKFDLVQDLNIVPGDLRPEVFVAEADHDYAERVWQRFRADESDAVIAIAPWSKRTWRRWNLEAWLEVMRKISSDRDICWILFADENERAELEVIENDLELDIRWAGARSLLQAAALIQRCNTMLCVDNGLKHLAVAVKTPALTVFTGSDPLVWNPPDNEDCPYFDLREQQEYDSFVGDVVGNLIQLIESHT